MPATTMNSQVNYVEPTQAEQSFRQSFDLEDPVTASESYARYIWELHLACLWIYINLTHIIDVCTCTPCNSSRPQLVLPTVAPLQLPLTPAVCLQSQVWSLSKVTYRSQTPAKWQQFLLNIQCCTRLECILNFFYIVLYTACSQHYGVCLTG